MSAGPPWLLGLQDELHHPIQGRKGKRNVRLRWWGLVAGIRRRRREPAFGNEVVKAGSRRIFDDTADGGGRRAPSEERYAAAI